MALPLSDSAWFRLDSPGLACLGLRLVDPGLVHLDGVGVNAQVLVLHNPCDEGVQHLPQGILTPLVPGKVVREYVTNILN